MAATPITRLRHLGICNIPAIKAPMRRPDKHFVLEFIACMENLS